MKIIMSLINLSDQLDKIGANNISDKIDVLIKGLNTRHKVAVFSDNPDDPAGRVAFFIDRAVDKLQRSENDLVNVADIIESGPLLAGSWMRVINDTNSLIIKARKNLEQFQLDTNEKVSKPEFGLHNQLPWVARG